MVSGYLQEAQTQTGKSQAGERARSFPERKGFFKGAALQLLPCSKLALVFTDPVRKLDLEMSDRFKVFKLDMH